jgi:hypothetical protein
MSTGPAVLFAFANDWSDAQHNLRSLLGESKAIGKALSPLESAGLRVLPVIHNATVDDVLAAFRGHPGQICIFHFAGHASDSSLLFEDDAGRPAKILAGPLAGYLGLQRGLALVFLNGCSTAPQVRRLREAGVKAVVATMQDIDDGDAAAFAEAFYAELATRPLHSAYEAAAYAVQAAPRASSGTIPRDVAGPSEQSTPGCPWMLDCDRGYEGWSLRSELDRLARRRLRVRILVAAAAALGMLLFLMLLSAGARRTACRAPGLRVVCMAIGIGPSADEQALWHHAIVQRTGQGLRAYLQRYPTGTYADEARSRLDGCSLQRVETPGPDKEWRYPLTVSANRTRLQATDPAARCDAMTRGQQDADTTCKLLGSSMTIEAALAEPRDWRCFGGHHGFTCGFDGEIVCRGHDRIFSDEERCNETSEGED